MLDVPQQNPLKYGFSGIEIYVLVISQYEYDILVITWVRGGAKDKC